jgi:hypothetical protein
MSWQRVFVPEIPRPRSGSSNASVARKVLQSCARGWPNLTRAWQARHARLIPAKPPGVFLSTMPKWLAMLRARRREAAVSALLSGYFVT